MNDPVKYQLFQASLAQFLGVSLAFVGCFGIFWGSQYEKWWLKAGIIVPFVVAYLTAIVGFIIYGYYARMPEPLGEGAYMWFVRSYLYADVLLLSIMVYFSGGVKQSLFTPLFFTIPAMAVLFVCSSMKLEIWMVTIATLAGYIIVYLRPVEKKIPGRLYRFCECTILVGSVFLTVSMSQWVQLLR